MQSYRKSLDDLDHDDSHSGVASDGLSANHKSPGGEWVSVMPPQIREKTEEWIDYFVGIQFERKRNTTIQRLMLIYKLNKSARINVSDYKYFASFFLVFTFFIVCLIVLGSRYLLHFISIYILLFAYTAIAIKRARKYVIEYLDKPEWFKNYFDKHNFRMQLCKADNLKELGEIEKALKIYEYLANKYYEAWIAKYQVGSCLMHLGRIEPARTYIYSLIEALHNAEFFKEKNYYLCVTNGQLGNMMEMEKNYIRAYEYFLTSFEFYSESWIAQSNLLYVCIKLRRFDEAKQWYKMLNTADRKKTIDLLSLEDIQYLKALPWIQKSYLN